MNQEVEIFNRLNPEEREAREPKEANNVFNGLTDVMRYVPSKKGLDALAKSINNFNQSQNK